MEAPATCKACGRLMRVATGCALGGLEGRERVPYGFAADEAGAPVTCPGCAVVNGQYHHWGCRVARCADCDEPEHAGSCEPPRKISFSAGEMLP